LRLQWLRQSMERALANGNPAHAASLYADAAQRLRDGDALQASALHALGARALDAGGDAEGAAAARARGAAALAALRAGMPPALLARYDSAGGDARQ
jgi:hypothetical protein